MDHDPREDTVCFCVEIAKNHGEKKERYRIGSVARMWQGKGDRTQHDRLPHEGRIGRLRRELLLGHFLTCRLRLGEPFGSCKRFFQPSLQNHAE